MTSPHRPPSTGRYSAEPTRNLMHYAQTVEDALFVSSHSKQVRFWARPQGRACQPPDQA